MRLLHVLPFIDERRGGSGTVTAALEQCAELRRRGHDAEVLGVWRGTGTAPQALDGVPTHLMGPVPGRRVPPRLVAWTRRNAPLYDLVHIHLSDDPLPLVAAGLVGRAGVPYLLQTHGVLHAASGAGRSGMIAHPLTPAVLRAAAGLICLDPVEREVITELAGRALPATVLTDGVHLGSPRPAPAAAPSPTVRDELDVITVARMHPRTEVLALLDVAEEVRRLGVPARFTLLGGDGPLSRPWDEAVTRRGLDDVVGRLGPRSRLEVLARVAEADVFLLPAADGERSMALREALALGVPTICTGRTRDAITVRARQAALVTRPGGRALARAVADLAADPDGRHDLGRRGRATAALLYDIRHGVDELERLYALAADRGLPGIRPPAPVVPAANVIDLAAAGRPAEPPTGTTGEAAPDGDPDRLLWVTATVSPARVDLWRALARHHDLTVAVLEDTGPGAGTAELIRNGAHEPFHLVRLDRPGALHTLIRRGPTTVVLDADVAGGLLGYRAMARAARWARREGITVVACHRAPSPPSSDDDARTRALPWPVRRLLRRVDAVLADGSPAVSAALAAGVPADRVALTPGLAEHPGGDTGGGARPELPVARVPGTPRRGELPPGVLDVREGHRFVCLLPTGAAAEQTELALRAFHLARGAGDTVTVIGGDAARTRRLAQELGVADQVRDPDLDGAAHLWGAQTVLVLGPGWDDRVEDALIRRRHVVLVEGAGQHGGVGVLLADGGTTGLARAMITSRQRWHRGPQVLTLPPTPRLVDVHRR